MESSFTLGFRRQHVKAGVQTHIWLRSGLTHISKVVLEERLDLSTNRGTTDVECAAISSVHGVGIVGTLRSDGCQSYLVTARTQDISWAKSKH
jgi:hypothetical protein